jgi:hypothetical protein
VSRCHLGKQTLHQRGLRASDAPGGQKAFPRLSSDRQRWRALLSVYRASIYRGNIQMKLRLAFFVMTALFAQASAGSFLPQSKQAAFSFANAQYFHRYTKDDLYEFTPDGQANLNAWADMVTINVYRNAKDGDGLAATANAVLETYKANRGTVVKTDSVPRTKTLPAEHLIAVVFGRPAFMEAVFARFKMHEGIGSAVIFSHRAYGKNAEQEMRAWLGKNGPMTEKNLLAWDAMPKLAALK